MSQSVKNPPVRKRPVLLASRVKSRVPLVTRPLRVKTRKATASLSGFVDAVINVARNSISTPHVLMVLAFTVFILYTHLNDTQSGPLSKFIASMREKDSTRTIGDWLDTNLDKFLGIIVFLPPFFSVQQRKRVFYAVISVSLILFLPVHTVYQYAILAILSMLYFKLGNSTYKMYLLFIIALVYFLGYLPNPFLDSVQGSESVTQAGVTPPTPAQKLSSAPLRPPIKT